MIGRLRGRSIAELRGRLAQQARALAERRGFLPSIVLPDAIVLTPVTPWPPIDASALRERIDPRHRSALLERADRVVNGTFDVLGVRGLSFGSPVNWQRDPLSGHEAIGVHWSRVPYLDHERVGDHKVTWELNRHQWFIALGQAWRLTGDAPYAATAVRLLREWLRANPPKRGINWVSALELSFRVQSWIHGLRLFDGAAELDTMLRTDLVTSAALQVDHIARNLSTWFSPNTHLTGEALALLSTGCAWPELPHAPQWRNEGWRILCDQLERQVRSDGVYFEQSTWYQCYTLDFYLLGMAWARHAGLRIPPAMPRRVREAARALRAVTRPDGTIARLGDDDGGRALPLTCGSFGDMTDSLWRAAVELDDESPIPPTDASRSALLWLEGSAAYDRMQGRVSPESSRSSRALREGGWIALTERNATPELDHWLVFDAGPHGALAHAHSHADALSIDLSVHGVPMLVDPGTGAYAGAMRQRYRSTAVHNTVTVDGADSSEQGSLFNWRSVTDSCLHGFGVTTGASFASASHDGYHRLPDPVGHLRTILRIDRRYWLVLDVLDAMAPHDIALTLQAAPDVHVESRGSGAFVLRSRGIVSHVTLDPQVRSAIVQRTVSPAYALELESDAIVATAAISGRTVLCSVLGADDESGPLEVQRSAPGAVWRIVHRAGADLVTCPARAPVTLGPARFDGTVLALLGAEEPHTIVAAGRGTLHLAGCTSELGADDIRVARRAPDGTWTMES